ncbi:MAG: pirin family protein [Chitinophagales bacterium]|nr:pirin family protein [Chitinophagales bacterium]
MATKNVEMIVAPTEPHYVGDGFRVHNFIPSMYRLDMERTNPFILLDYNSKFVFPPSNAPRGVGVHPHKGFETVTIAYKGKVQHHDSHGGGGIIGEGDVQWMTAASGLLHKEYHETAWSKQGGEFQMVQLWVNLPAKEKAGKPKYQAIDNADMQKIALDDKGSIVEVIAGSYQGHQGSAFTFTPIEMYNARLKKGVSADFDFPAIYNTVMLVVEGSIIVNGSETVPTDHLVLMDNQGTSYNITAQEDAVVLVLSGQPIPEPIAAHGPFVMNTRQELMEAYQQFNQGKFGNLDF